VGTHISIDPDTRIIDLLTAPVGGLVTLDMREDIYSEAKEDWIATPSLRKLRFPLRDPITVFVKGVWVGPFVFVDNESGWRIRPYDADHELTINGDFLASDETIPLFLPRSGRTIIGTIVLSARSQTVEVSGNAPWNATEKAQIRYVLGVDGTTIPVTGTPELVNLTLDESLIGHSVSNSLAFYVQQANIMFIRLIGLNHENSYIDNTEHDDYMQIISARVRVFDSKANAEAAQDGDNYSTGLLETYTAETEWESPGRMKSYRFVRE